VKDYNIIFDQAIKGMGFVPNSLREMGCRYCQAQTAHKNGVAVEKLQKIWEFESSDLFLDKERAALRFALAAGSVPNQVTVGKHEA